MRPHLQYSPPLHPFASSCTLIDAVCFVQRYLKWNKFLRQPSVDGSNVIKHAGRWASVRSAVLLLDLPSLQVIPRPLPPEWIAYLETTLHQLYLPRVESTPRGESSHCKKDLPRESACRRPQPLFLVVAPHQDAEARALRQYSGPGTHRLVLRFEGSARGPRELCSQGLPRNP